MQAILYFIKLCVYERERTPFASSASRILNIFICYLWMNVINPCNTADQYQFSLSFPPTTSPTPAPSQASSVRSTECLDCVVFEVADPQQISLSKWPIWSRKTPLVAPSSLSPHFLWYITTSLEADQSYEDGKVTSPLWQWHCFNVYPNQPQHCQQQLRLLRSCSSCLVCRIEVRILCQKT